MKLQAELETLVAQTPNHMIGAAVVDIASGETIAAVNAGRAFQLASMFKVPVLVAAMRQVDAGTLDLDIRYTLDETQKLIGSGLLSYLDAGLQPTLRDLLTLMIIVSDNTATDIVLTLLGGVDAIAQTLRDLEIMDIYIRHTTRDLLWAVFPSDTLALTEPEIKRIVREQDLVRHDADVAPDAATNTGTPAALCALLRLIEQGRVASPESTALMRTILKRQTYNHRLPLSWSEDIEFAHKTGTLSDMRGDCGIVYLPGEKTLAISAIVQATDATLPLDPELEQAGDALLAQIGALVWQWAAERAD